MEVLQTSQQRPKPQPREGAEPRQDGLLPAPPPAPWPPTDKIKFRGGTARGRPKLGRIPAKRFKPFPEGLRAWCVSSAFSFFPRWALALQQERWDTEAAARIPPRSHQRRRPGLPAQVLAGRPAHTSLTHMLSHTHTHTLTQGHPTHEIHTLRQTTHNTHTHSDKPHTMYTTHIHTTCINNTHHTPLYPR